MKKTQVEMLAEFILLDDTGSRADSVNTLEKTLEELGATEEDTIAFLKRALLVAFEQKKGAESTLGKATLESVMVGFGQGTLAAFNIYVGKSDDEALLKQAHQAQQNWGDVCTHFITAAHKANAVDGGDLMHLLEDSIEKSKDKDLSIRVIGCTLSQALATYLNPAKEEEAPSEEVPVATSTELPTKEDVIH